MHPNEFEQVLKDNEIEYRRTGVWFEITHKDYVYLLIESMPSHVIFENDGAVDLEELKELPPQVYFRNSGDILLPQLKWLPCMKSKIFNNDGKVKYDDCDKEYCRLDEEIEEKIAKQNAINNKREEEREDNSWSFAKALWLGILIKSSF